MKIKKIKLKTMFPLRMGTMVFYLIFFTIILLLLIFLCMWLLVYY